MKSVVFGGFVFIGGTIMFSISSISLFSFLQWSGIFCMLIGVVLGITGLIKK